MYKNILFCGVKNCYQFLLHVWRILTIPLTCVINWYQFSYKWSTDTNSPSCEELVPISHKWDKLVLISHTWEELVPILHTCEESVPNIRICEESQLIVCIYQLRIGIEYKMQHLWVFLLIWGICMVATWNLTTCVFLSHVRNIGVKSVTY